MERCPNCKRFGLEGIGNSLMKCLWSDCLHTFKVEEIFPELLEKKENWEEEFEETMFNAGATYGGIYLESDKLLEKIIEKYLDISQESGTFYEEYSKKVKIKARKGKIIIERIEE